MINNPFKFFIPQTITVINSPLNGKIEVIKHLGNTKIVVNNMLQSGGLVELIWKKGIKAISNQQLAISNCLILGLGGGSAAQIISKKFPQAKIIGIEIDPLMIKLGKKYFGLGKIKNLKIICQDAIDFIIHDPLSMIHYDLILVDLYLGDLIPQKSQSVNFLQQLKKILSLNGAIIINCLFYGKHRIAAKQVVLNASRVFPHVNLIRAWSNLLVVCQS